MSKWRPSLDGCLYVIPDIHGNFSLLEKIMARILPLRNTTNARDKIIFLGDYIDRHVDSASVIDFIISLKETYKEQVITIKGNHEDLFLKSLGINCSDTTQNFSRKTWVNNGGIQTISSYLKKNELKINPYNVKMTELKELIPESHINFLLNCQAYHKEDNFVFVHGGYDPTYSIEEYLKFNSEFNLYWDGTDRTLFNFMKNILLFKSKVHWEEVIICGHSGPIPIFHPKYRMLDAGAPRQLLLYEARSNQALLSLPNKQRLKLHSTNWTELKP